MESFFRILDLHPGRHDDPIACYLRNQNLEASKNKYEAISYVWRGPAQKTDVVCNGVRVAITYNLASALRNFRTPDESRNSWADALCINPRDDQEKSSQVTRMRQIYTNAFRVLVWLGPDKKLTARETYELMRQRNKHFTALYRICGKSFSNMPPLNESLSIFKNE